MVHRKILSEDPDLLRLGCKSKLIASLEEKQTGASFTSQIVAEEEVHGFIWDVVNEGQFMEKYFQLYTIPQLKASLQSALQSDIHRVSVEIPIGKNFFARTMLLDAHRQPYKQEAHSLVQLLDPHPQQILKWSRRLGKSFYMKTDMSYFSVFEPGCYSLYLCQSWDVSKEHLKAVSEWFNRNPLLFKFAGGELSWRLMQKWSDSDIYLMNGSRMSCRSATLSRKLSGKSPNRLYEDEKALYSRSSISEELGIMKRGQADRTIMSHIIASAPAGDGTLFEKIWNDERLNQYWKKSFLPMCEEITFDDAGIPHFHGIATNRVTEQDLLEDYYYLGRDRFMEQYMLITMHIDNRAIPEHIIESFFDRSQDGHQKMQSDKPCILSYDLGKSAAHRHIVMIGEVQENKKIKIIRIIEYPPGYPIRQKVLSRDDDGNPKNIRSGVIENIVELCDHYNITHVIGDATGMGADEPFAELKEMLVPLGIPSENVIAYKWSSNSKEFMGKYPLWKNLVQPRMEKGDVSCFYDEDFQWQMNVWQAIESPTGATTLLRPQKQTYSDDKITAMMQLVFAAFRHNLLPPIKSSIKQTGLLASRKESYATRTTRRRDIEPRWRSR